MHLKLIPAPERRFPRRWRDNGQKTSTSVVIGMRIVDGKEVALMRSKDCFQDKYFLFCFCFLIFFSSLIASRFLVFNPLQSNSKSSSSSSRNHSSEEQSNRYKFLEQQHSKCNKQQKSKHLQHLTRSLCVHALHCCISLQECFVFDCITKLKCNTS